MSLLFKEVQDDPRIQKACTQESLLISDIPAAVKAVILWGSGTVIEVNDAENSISVKIASISDGMRCSTSLFLREDDGPIFA